MRLITLFARATVRAYDRFAHWLDRLFFPKKPGEIFPNLSNSQIDIEWSYFKEKTRDKHDRTQALAAMWRVGWEAYRHIFVVLYTDRGVYQHHGVERVEVSEGRISVHFHPLVALSKGTVQRYVFVDKDGFTLKASHQSISVVEGDTLKLNYTLDNWTPA